MAVFRHFKIDLFSAEILFEFFWYFRGLAGILQRRSHLLCFPKPIRTVSNFRRSWTLAPFPAPMFLLVPQVTLKKRLDIAAAAEKWADAVPGLVIRNWRG